MGSLGRGAAPVLRLRVQSVHRADGAALPRRHRPQTGHTGDHDWLINERGVATVEPFTGSCVHGVLWRVSDHDLATLDSAEGVPVRYRRDRLIVHTDDGPSPAWVYVDPRVEPGPPRPGYLERIIDGARHHGLPHRWIDFLHRWDPAHWPHSHVASDGAAPQTLSELLADPAVIELKPVAIPVRLPGHPRRRSGADDGRHRRAAADAAGASVYLLRHPRAIRTIYRRPAISPQASARLSEFLEHVDVVVSVHGYGRIGRSTQLLAGGGNRALAQHLARHIDVPGYQVVTDLDAIPAELRGLHPDNPVNRGAAAAPSSNSPRGCAGSAHAASYPVTTVSRRRPPCWCGAWSPRRTPGRVDRSHTHPRGPVLRIVGVETMNPELTPALYPLRVTHLRRSPVHHYAEHRSYSWYVDIDRLPGCRAGCARSPGSRPSTTSTAPR